MPVTEICFGIHFMEHDILYITTWRTWVTYLSSGKFSTENNHVLLRAFLAPCLTQHPVRKERKKERKKTSTAARLHLKVVLVLRFYGKVLLKYGFQASLSLRARTLLVSSVLQRQQYNRA